MKTLRIIPVLLLVLCLLPACGGRTEPAPTTAAPTTAGGIETQPSPERPTDGLLDFALLDRLFDTAYGEYLEEEGREAPPLNLFEGSMWCEFSAYAEGTMFFFEPDWESDPPKVDAVRKPIAVFFDPPGLLADKQTLTLGELEEWLKRNDIPYETMDYEEDGPMCTFQIGDYAFGAALEDESVFRFTVHCGKNYAG